MILAEISIGDFKPNFDNFLNPIIMQLKKLEYGINIVFADSRKEIKLFLTHAFMDKPAKASVINMICRTGFFGCSKCKKPGEDLPVKTNNIKVLIGISL